MNIEMIAIARDSPKKLLDFKKKNNISIPIYPDRKGNVVKEYRVFQLVKMSDLVYLITRIAIPSTYIINNEGIITWAYVGNREDRPPIDLILQAIKENLPHIPS